MNLTRREFLLLSAGMVAGCKTVDGSPTASQEHMVNAGPVADYATDGVYGHFRDQGFFIIRRGNQLFALSAICTHRKCKLSAEPDRSFYCPCHGSTFDPTGHVTNGPARRDLPTLPSDTNALGQLIVNVLAR